MKCPLVLFDLCCGNPGRGILIKHPRDELLGLPGDTLPAWLVKVDVFEPYVVNSHFHLLVDEGHAACEECVKHDT